MRSCSEKEEEEKTFGLGGTLSEKYRHQFSSSSSHTMTCFLCRSPVEWRRVEGRLVSDPYCRSKECRRLYPSFLRSEKRKAEQRKKQIEVWVANELSFRHQQWIEEGKHDYDDYEELADRLLTHDPAVLPNGDMSEALQQQAQRHTAARSMWQLQQLEDEYRRREGEAEWRQAQAVEEEKEKERRDKWVVDQMRTQHESALRSIRSWLMRNEELDRGTPAVEEEDGWMLVQQKSRK
jgi:hypothetical protein